MMNDEYHELWSSANQKKLHCSRRRGGPCGHEGQSCVYESDVMSMSPCCSDPPPPFRVEPGAVRWLRPGLRKYSCELTIDTNTVNRKLKLSDNNRKVTYVKEDESYLDHPDRFDIYPQLLCRTGLTGRCYWEVEWRGYIDVSVSYRGIRRKGDSDDCWFGWNDQSWSLSCSDKGYYIRHNKTETRITTSSSSSSGRVAVYVDCPAGSLSFYRVSSDSVIHLHTFNSTFTEPLYPGFWFGSCPSPGSSVSLNLRDGESPPGGEPSSLLTT
ncbi:stonustoxin subunit alpha-like [Gasterosteus aculeatus]